MNKCSKCGSAGETFSPQSAFSGYHITRSRCSNTSCVKHEGVSHGYWQDSNEEPAKLNYVQIDMPHGECIVGVCNFRDKVVVATQSGLWIMEEDHDAYYRLERVPI